MDAHVKFNPDKFGAYTFYGWLSGFSLALSYVSWWYSLLALFFFILQLRVYALRIEQIKLRKWTK